MPAFVGGGERKPHPAKPRELPTFRQIDRIKKQVIALREI
jgi:hypothetical protein